MDIGTYLTYCLTIIPLLTSCTFVPRATIGSGYIDWNLGVSDQINTKGHPYPVRGFDTSARLEADVAKVGPFIIDLGVGSHIVTTDDYRGDLYGVVASNRIRWKAADWFEPYLLQLHSADYFEHTWATEGVHYGFTTQFGAGVRFASLPIEGLSMSVDWRWWHNSWGKSFYGDWFRKALDLRKEGPNVGFESGGIFVELSYDF